jgi:hypothetical protein
MNPSESPETPATGRRLARTIILQSLAIAVAGIAVWWIVRMLGGSRDTAWALAAIVWVIGSPVIELIRTAKRRKPAS